MYYDGKGSPHKFKKGVSGNPGGTPNSRRVFTNNFVSSFAKDFAEHGHAVLVAARETDPIGYLRIAVAIADLPKSVSVDVTKRTAHDYSDDELLAIIAGGSAGGDEPATEPAGTAEVH